jgi:hypothetical protein
MEFARPAAVTSGLTIPPSFLVADPRALFALSLVDGARSKFASGSGAPFVDLVGVIAGNGMIVSSGGACIAALDAGLPGVIGSDGFVISGGTVGSGPAFARPRAMAAEPGLVPFGGCPASVLVLDKELGGPAAVLRVGLGAGNRTVLSDATHGLGPGLVDPVAIALDPSTGTAFVLDAGALAILTVDPVSGDRAVAFAFTGFVGEPTGLALELANDRIQRSGEVALPRDRARRMRA